jgi:hypothetical protein
MLPLDPNSPCSTCAFRAGAGANKEVYNRLRAMVAALGAVPFTCHHAPDGRELNWKAGPIEYVNSLSGRRDIRVCAGWKSEVRKLARRGRFRDLAARTRFRAVASFMLDGIQEAVNAPEPEKPPLFAALRELLRFLTASTSNTRSAHPPCSPEPRPGARPGRASSNADC